MVQGKNNRFLIWAIIASQVAPPFMFSGVAVALPMMGAHLKAGATSLGLVETLFLAGQLAFLLPMGRLADASDKRVLYKVGLLGSGISALLIGMSSSIPAILCLRFLQGIGSSICAATGPAILADIVPAERRSRAYGSSISAIYAGLTLGPVCAGFLVHLWGWRAVFLAGAAALLLVSVLIHFMMAASWRKPPAKAVNLPSTMLVVTAVLCLVGGSAMLHNGPAGYGLLLSGVLFGTAFVRLQRHLEQPLLNIDGLMRNHRLRNALLIQLLLYVNAYSMIFMLSIYLQVSLGHPARLAGQILAIGSLIMTVMAPVSGILVGRYRSHLISSFGVAFVLIATLIGMQLNEQSGLWMVALLLVFQGLGFALFSTPNMTLIMNSVPSHKTSIASALGAKARSLGMMFGMLVTTILISLHFGNDPIAQHPTRFVETMVTTLSILAVLTATALVICFLTRARRETTAEKIHS